MPKLKTVKSVSKRFRKTKTGKILRSKMSAQHLAGGKSKRCRRNSSKPEKMFIGNKIKIGRMI